MKLLVYIVLFWTIPFGKWNHAPVKHDLHVTSPAFHYDGRIPSWYTCRGENTNPELNVSNIPEGTRTLAIIMEDKSFKGITFVHWIAWNIPVSEDNNIPSNSIIGMEGQNDLGSNGYIGPCPPQGVHLYVFRVMALNTILDLPETSDKTQLENAMRGHILMSGEIRGYYGSMRSNM